MSKIDIFIKNRIFCRKSKFLSKIKIFHKNRIFLSKIEFFVKNRTFFENWNFCQNENVVPELGCCWNVVFRVCRCSCKLFCDKYISPESSNEYYKRSPFGRELRKQLGPPDHTFPNHQGHTLKIWWNTESKKNN